METILDVSGVSKRYGRREVLREITFSAEKGEIIALLGRNGTGKSTLMNMITGYLCQTGGKIAVCGDDTLESPMKARAHIGYLPEQPPLYPDMTVWEYLHYCAQLRGMSRKQQKLEAERVIELTGLNEYASRLSGRLSKGYRQRLGVAQALLPHPSLLILDEPGSGLDPLADGADARRHPQGRRRKHRAALLSLAQRGHQRLPPRHRARSWTHLL